MPNKRLLEHCRLLVSCILINPSRSDFFPLGTSTAEAALRLMHGWLVRLAVGAKSIGERGQLTYTQLLLASTTSRGT